jgi:hypothetical protein
LQSGEQDFYNNHVRDYAGKLDEIIVKANIAGTPDGDGPSRHAPRDT